MLFVVEVSSTSVVFSEIPSPVVAPAEELGKDEAQTPMLPPKGLGLSRCRPRNLIAGSPTPQANVSKKRLPSPTVDNTIILCLGVM